MEGIIPEDLELVEKYCRQLTEHFDTVEILVTRYNNETKATRHLNSGIGNSFARYGQIKDWVTRWEQGVRDDKSSTIEPEDPEEPA